jgi:hypothetical protein
MSVHPAFRWTLRVIARLEGEGNLRPRRLTEPGFTRWHRLSPKPAWRTFVSLLHEDLTPVYPVPFDLDRWSGRPLDALTEEEAEALVLESSTPDMAEPAAFLRGAARDFGLPAGGAIADLPRTAPGQRILELPGSGGRIAAWQVANQPGLAFHAQFTFVADTDAERIMVGLAAAECRANEPTILSTAEALAAIARGERFDRLVGHADYEPAVRFASQAGQEARWV